MSGMGLQGKGKKNTENEDYMQETEMASYCQIALNETDSTWSASWDIFIHWNKVKL